MSIHRALFAAFPLTAIVLTGLARSETPTSAALQGSRAKLHAVRLDRQRGGGPLLVIEYPWKVHEKATIEVHLVTAKEGAAPEGPPMFFLKNLMQGDVPQWVYRAQDKAEEAENSRSFTKNDIDYEILGWRSCLQKGAVCAIRRFKSHAPSPGVAGALLSLGAWGLTERQLQVDLPQPAFAEPGRLYLWFLRGEKVLWSETLDWPGR